MRVTDSPHLARVTAREGHRLCDEYGIPFTVRQGGVKVDSHVAAFYTLSRGSVVLEHPDVSAPFTFLAQVGGHRAHVVVCREYGDVEYPARLRALSAGVVAAGVLAVREGLADAREAVAESQARLSRARQPTTTPA